MKRTEQYSERLSRLYPELHEPVGTEKILTQTVTFQVTDDCNLACKYCYQTHKGKKKMSFETAKKMVDLLLSGNKGVGDYINPQKSPGLIIDFIGGEPLLEIELIDQIGAEFKKRFADKNINKILTIEASGIGIACIVAKHFHVPVVFAKKTQSINLEGEMYVAEVESFTHKCKNQVIVAKKFLSEEDHVLIIDDFLANGCALQGLIQLVTEAGATVEGIGIVIEKGFQSGGRIIRNLGYPLESLAIVEAMDSETGEITFREQ